MPGPQLTQFAVLPPRPKDNENGLLCWWPLLGASAGGINDFSGHQQNGVLVGTPTPVLSPAGPGLHCAANSVSYVNSVSNIATSSQMAFSCWFNPDAAPSSTSDYVVLFNGGGSGHNAFGFTWGSTGPQSAVFGSNASGTFVQAQISPFPTAGRWCHIVGTYDGSQIHAYLNGVLISNATVAITPTSGSFSTGVFTNTSNGGSIADFRFYNRLLSAAEIVTLYQQALAFPLGMGESDLPALPFAPLFAGAGGLGAILTPLQPQSLMVPLSAAGGLTAATQPFAVQTVASFAAAGALVATQPSIRLSTEYAEVITSGSNPQDRLSTQYAEVVTSGSNPQDRLSTQYAEIISDVQGTPFVLQQESFRFRTDTGPVDGTPTWAAAENVAYNPGALPFRLRISLDNIAGDGSPPAPFPYAIYVSRNGGPYQPVTGVSTNACVGTGGNSEPNGTPILIPRLTRPV